MKRWVIGVLPLLAVCCRGDGSDSTHALRPGGGAPPSRMPANEVTPIACPLPDGAASEAASRWSVVAFDQSLQVFWILSAQAASGPVTIRRYFNLGDGDRFWEILGTWRYDQSTGSLTASSVDGSSPAEVRLVVSIDSTSKSGLGRLEETYEVPGMAAPAKRTSEVVTFIGRSDNLFQRLTMLRACQLQALAEVR